jgi:hypothetical protein
MKGDHIMLVRTGIFVLLLVAADLLQAAPDAVVESIQLPAWVSRDGKRQPLSLGTELKSDDEVSTEKEANALGARLKENHPGLESVASLR